MMLAVDGTHRVLSMLSAAPLFSPPTLPPTLRLFHRGHTGLLSSVFVDVLPYGGYPPGAARLPDKPESVFGPSNRHLA